MSNKKDINLFDNFFDIFLRIAKNSTIKFNTESEKYETLESRANGDEYINAVYKKDKFTTYDDYDHDEMKEVGLTNSSIINEVLDGYTSSIPPEYREKILNVRRRNIIEDYEEMNNYYRMLNGLPDIEDERYLYLSTEDGIKYDAGSNIPIHLIQDHYNDIKSGRGDFIINKLHANGVIDEFINKYPDRKYLKYLGNNRVPIHLARTAKNFQIINRKGVETGILADEFFLMYEQCREYFLSTIYTYDFTKVIEKYDNLIAMCIMLMAIQQVLMRQPLNIVRLNFFNTNTLKMFYDSFDIPYDLSLPSEKQNLLVKNLNLFIYNKSSNKVLLDIQNLMSLSNLKIYKYYLVKEIKYDKYGAPVFETKNKFNENTGVVEKVPNYETMYNIYFKKVDLQDDTDVTITNDKNSYVSYNEIISKDPYWIEDGNLKKRVWESTYNMIESKYLGLSVSYRLTDIMFENVIFFKMLFAKKDEISDVKLNISKLTDDDIPLFDTIITLICLLSSYHNLYGEIVSVPTQVVSVLDYLHNKNGADTNLDTLKFNFNYFFNPTEATDKNAEVSGMKDKLVEYHSARNDKVRTLGFNFNKLEHESSEIIERIKKILGKDDFEKFRSYIQIVNSPSTTNSDKIEYLNNIFVNIKNMSKLLMYYLTKVSSNRKDYQYLKQLYEALFYSKEVSDLFTITGDATKFKRTAYTYFEYLYSINPKIYSSIFEIDMNENYNDYLKKNKLTSATYTYDMFEHDVELGKIFIDYSKIKGIAENLTGEEYQQAKSEKIQSLMNNIIGNLQKKFADVEFSKITDSSNSNILSIIIKLIQFFKSYTVDVINFDSSFIFDFKINNCLKMIDEIHKVDKKTLIKDKNLFNYIDTLHNKTISVKLRDKMGVTKEELFLSTSLKLHVLDKYKINRNLMTLKFKDKFNNITKSFYKVDNFRFFDIMKKMSNIGLNKDNLKFKDKVFKV